MADLSDVEQSIVNEVSQVLYPSGTGNPSALIVGGIHIACRVSRGWPNRAALDSDMRANIANVTIFPMNMERNVTRFNREWYVLPYSDSAVTLTVDATAGTVTLGGTLPNPYAVQNFAVVAGNQVFPYTLQSADTLTTVATALAGLIAVSFPGTTSSGQVITVVGALSLTAAVGVVAGVLREVKRQIRYLRVILWCSIPAMRDALGILLDPAIAANIWLTMPDGTRARVRAEQAPAPQDNPQTELLYRRDLVYTVEYSTSQTQAAEQITAITAVLTETTSNTTIATIAV
jgi:hypothetical protein